MALVVSQTQSNQYPGSTSQLSVSMPQNQGSGNTIVVTVTHDPSQTCTVSDISGGDTYTKTGSTGTNPVTDTFTAYNVIGLGWNDVITASFSAATNNPSMTAVEYTNIIKMPAQQDTTYPRIIDCTTPQPYSLIKGDGTTYEIFCVINGKKIPKHH